ncbi:MAG: hypothetical protein IPO33_06510 [Saprospiraceae bacterium]|nr:hypothetical protein [Candidatus Brachybacter algidus]
MYYNYFEEDSSCKKLSKESLVLKFNFCLRRYLLFTTLPELIPREDASCELFNPTLINTVSLSSAGLKLPVMRSNFPKKLGFTVAKLWKKRSHPHVAGDGNISELFL